MIEAKNVFNFECMVEFEGFEISGEFDSDVLIRAFGNKSGDTVASLIFEIEKQETAVISYLSMGEQKIGMDTSDEEALEIARKYVDRDMLENSAEKEEIIIEFLDNFIDSFNKSELTEEKEALLYKELNKQALIEFYNNSWIEERILLTDANGSELYDEWTQDTVYGSIDEVYLSSRNEAIAHYGEHIEEMKDYLS